MTGRSTQILRGLGSLALLGLLLVGPPLVLAAFIGWPLPTAIPDLDTVQLALRSGVNDDVIVKGLALLAWMAWIQIAIAVMTEVVAVTRRRPAMRLPVMPGFQAAAGRLVASVAMMTATISPAAATAASAPPTPIVAYTAPAPIAVPLPIQVPPPMATTPAETPPSPPPSPPAPTTVTVERHDSYWAIAERTLGDGYLWREVRDQNVGRTMNTGHVVQPGSDLVLPGWVLELPPDADRAAPAEPGRGVPAGAPAEVVVEPGDNFWELAEEQLATTTGEAPTDLETLPYWQDMIEANEERLVQPGNPSLILPGQSLAVPPVPGVAPAGGPEAAPAPPVSADPPPADPVPSSTVDSGEQSSPGTPASPPPTTDATSTTVTPPTSAAPAATPAPPTSVAPTPPAESAAKNATDDGSGIPLPAIAAGVASAAFAVGATQAIRRRRLRSAHRSPTAAPPPTSETLGAIHRGLVAAADVEGVDGLRTALGSLARVLAEEGADVRPRVVQHGSDHLDVLLDTSVPPPDGWTAADGEAMWTLDHLPESHADDPICATPLLVTLGQPDDGGQLYLDLEAEQLVALVGDPVAARAVARAMLVELALTPLADTLEVLVIGDLAPAAVTELDHVTLAASWDEVAEDLTAWAEQSHDAVTENGWPNGFIARGADAYHDALTPIVAVGAEPPPADLLDHLRSHRMATLTVVAIGSVAGSTVIECRPDSLTVVDLGLECSPYPMEPEVLDAVIDLLHDSEEIVLSDPEGQLSLLPPSLRIEPDLDADLESVAEPNYEVLVRVLGDITVEGGEPLAAKQTAVVAYIALHGTVSADKLEDAVWASPTTANRRKRLANTISECRAALGRHHFPPASDGRYRAGPGIVTDLELFDRRVRRAADQSPTEAADTLLTALDLVTGPLFTYRAVDRASFAWVEVENWASTWELKVAAAAQRCADLLLDIGRAEEAADVALRILGIMPTHAGLTENLMRAHAANGDRTAVERVYRDHVNALHALDLDEVGEATTALLQDLRIGSS